MGVCVGGVAQQPISYANQYFLQPLQIINGGETQVLAQIRFKLLGLIYQDRKTMELPSRSKEQKTRRDHLSILSMIIEKYWIPVLSLCHGYQWMWQPSRATIPIHLVAFLAGHADARIAPLQLPSLKIRNWYYQKSDVTIEEYSFLCHLIILNTTHSMKTYFISNERGSQLKYKKFAVVLASSKN